MVPVDEMLQLGVRQIAFWWITLTGLGATVWVFWSDQHRRQWADRDLAWLLWHWVTGGPLEPRRTFPELDDDRPTAARWGERAGRAAARTVGTVATASAVYVGAGAPRGTDFGTVAAAGGIGTVGLTAVTWLIVWAAVRAAHYLQWVRPLHDAVHKPAGWDEDKRPGSYITVPRNRTEGGDGIVVGVAPNFDLRDQRKTAVEGIIRGKLDLPAEDVTTNWVTAGRHYYVQVRPRAKMPESAMFSDPEIRRLVEQAKESAPIIGITRGNEPVQVDLDTESPHVLLSAGTGGGKSSTIRTIAAQLMRNGAKVTVLDIKRHSHQWLRPLPGVTYARDLGEIHRVLVELGQEGHRRNVLFDDVDIDEEGPRFQRHVILCEELNATTSVLREWWKNHRTSDDPPTSPAVRSLGQILFMGRAVRIHVLAIAQMATAKDMGGTEMRENFATRILARHTKNAWNMLVPECPYQPGIRHPGRIFVCIGGQATETQGVFMSQHEARAFVAERRGLAEIDVAGVASREHPGALGGQAATVAARGHDRKVEGLTIRELSADGVGAVMLRYDALRQASLRDPEFPRPIGRRGVGRLYDPAEIQRWELNRPSGGRGTTPGGEGNEVDEVDRMEQRIGG